MLWPTKYLFYPQANMYFIIIASPWWLDPTQFGQIASPQPEAQIHNKQHFGE